MLYCRTCGGSYSAQDAIDCIQKQSEHWSAAVVSSPPAGQQDSMWVIIRPLGFSALRKEAFSNYFWNNLITSKWETISTSKILVSFVFSLHPPLLFVYCALFFFCLFNQVFPPLPLHHCGFSQFKHLMLLLSPQPLPASTSFIKFVEPHSSNSSSFSTLHFLFSLCIPPFLLHTAALFRQSAIWNCLCCPWVPLLSSCSIEQCSGVEPLPANPLLHQIHSQNAPYKQVRPLHTYTLCQIPEFTHIHSNPSHWRILLHTPRWL